MVEAESCEKNILLRDPSRSANDACVHTYARTDLPTCRIASTSTHMHAGMHARIKVKKTQNQLKREFLKTRKIRNLKTIIKTFNTRISTTTSCQSCKKSSQQKKKTIFDQNSFFVALRPKTCTQSAKIGDGITEQTCTQFLAAVIECGDMAERGWQDDPRIGHRQCGRGEVVCGPHNM